MPLLMPSAFTDLRD